MWYIYKLTSPSGKCYVGQTKCSVAERWQKHRRRAEKEARNHPLYNAMRKYGAEAFVVETIDTADTREEAYRKERFHIAQVPKEVSYNISPGGEMDGEAGAKVFWDSVADRESPKYVEYHAKLVEAGKRRSLDTLEALQVGAAAWRKANPKQAYKLARRAARIATNTIKANRPAADASNRDRKSRLMWRYKRGKAISLSVSKTWKEGSPEWLAARKKGLSEGKKRYWEGVTDKEERSALTSVARAAIDRAKQGSAASKGVKQFWVDLKADPERYAAYMKERTASLNKTLKAKGYKLKDENV